MSDYQKEADGGYIDYNDHLAAIEQLQKQIVELELQVRSISLSRNAEIAKEAFKVVMEALEYDDGRYIETESDRLDMIEEYVTKLRERGK